MSCEGGEILGEERREILVVVVMVMRGGGGGGNITGGTPSDMCCACGRGAGGCRERMSESGS